MVERWCSAISRRQTHRALEQCLAGWQQLKGAKQSRKKIAVRLARRWMKRDIARPFFAWHGITWDNVGQERAWRRQVRRSETNTLGAAFGKFAHTIVGKWKLELLLLLFLLSTCPSHDLICPCMFRSTAQRRLGRHIRKCCSRRTKQDLSWRFAHWHECTASSQKLAVLCRYGLMPDREYRADAGLGRASGFC